MEVGKIIKDEPVEIPINRGGKCFIKRVGHIRCRHWIGKLYECKRELNNGQCFYKYPDQVSISKSIFDRWLIPQGVDGIKIMFTDRKTNESYAIFFSVRDFINKSKLVKFEDEQYMVKFTDRPRIYSNQSNIWGHVEEMIHEKKTIKCEHIKEDKNV